MSIGTTVVKRPQYDHESERSLISLMTPISTPHSSSTMRRYACIYNILLIYIQWL